MTFRCSVPISFFAGILLLVHSSAILGEELRIPSGSLVEHRSDSSVVPSAEAFEVPEQVLAALLTARGPVLVNDFPVAPGQREPVRWEKVEVWAPRAKLHVQTETGVDEREPPRGLFFRGTGMVSGAALAARLTDGRLSGLASVDGIVHHIVPRAAGDGSLHAVERHVNDDRTLDQTCANANEVLNDSVFRGSRPRGGTLDDLLARGRTEAFGSPEPVSAVQRDLAAARGGALKQAVIAIDTDTSFMASKGPGIADVNDYIADLFLYMNTMYERDLDLRLLIGDTFYNAVSDPFTNGSGASSAHLNNFADYWNTTPSRQAVDRVFALLLSGESGSSTSASGIARFGSNTYCGNRGYSVNQIFKVDRVDLDAGLVGHEIGHNAGSRHTHCYNPPVDQCFAGESGCYGGGTSCPAGGGTTMSYCNSGACFPAQNKLEFHPTVAGVITTQIDNNYPTCVEPLGGTGDQIFGDGFEDGNTNAWL